MEVVATRDGHYGGVYRFAGDTFEVEKDAKASWFKPVGAEKVEKPEPKTARGAGVARKANTIGDLNMA